jgi:hypothetical protein
VRTKVTMTLLVRDEQDIIEDNIRFHHQNGVDSFIVMDNASTDATSDILNRLSREIPIDCLYQPQVDYAQSEWVTWMARRAAVDHGADWVINNDADEFWLPENGTYAILLAHQPQDVSGVLVKRHNAAVINETNTALSGQTHPRTSCIFETTSLNIDGNQLPGKMLHRASPDVTVAQGNHKVQNLPGHFIGAENLLSILHFPHRSFSKYTHKIRVGGAAYARNSMLPLSLGKAWRLHYEKLQAGALEGVWQDIVTSPTEMTQGLDTGALFTDSRLVDYLDSSAIFDERTPLRPPVKGDLSEVDDLGKDPQLKEVACRTKSHSDMI